MPSFRWLFGSEGEVVQDADFQMLLLASIIAPLGITIVSPILSSLEGPFAVTATSLSLMVSMFTAPAIVVIPLAGVLSDKYGRKRVLVTGLLLFGVAGSAIAFAPSFAFALGLRALQGIGFAGVAPIIITSIGDLYTGTEEATAQGLRFTVSGIVQTVFPPIGGLLVIIAWQYPFLLYALSLPIAVMVYFWFDEPVNRSTSTSSATANGGSSNQSFQAVLVIVRQRRVLAIIVCRALPLLIWIGFLTYNSIIIVQIMGGTPVQAGVLAAIGSSVFAISATQTGRITNQYDTRFVPLVAANVALGGGFVIVYLAPSLAIATIGVLAGGLGLGILMPLYRSIITGFAPPSLRGRLVSLSEAGGRIGATLTPILMAAIIQVQTPIIGFDNAVKVAGLSTTIVATVGSVFFLYIARAAPPVTSQSNP